MKRYLYRAVSILAILAVMAPVALFAHCDTMDGPVVMAAKKALQTGELNPVLIWIKPADEAEIKKAFEQTLAVRKLDEKAKQFADQYFFETLVRVHRAGEGMPYTGLKAAGTDIDKGITAADQAMESGNVDAVKAMLNDAINHGLDERFRKVVAAQKFEPADVKSGREYVEAYVVFIHYVEGLYGAAMAAPGHAESGETKAHEGHNNPH